MHIEVIAEVFIAVFAVYGVFCAIQLLLEHAFFARAFYLAVYVEKGDTLDRIGKKLCYARLISERERGAKCNPIIFVSEKEEYERIEAIKELGAKVYSTKLL